MKLDVSGIHNRGPLKVAIPTARALQRAQHLRGVANIFRGVAEELQDIAPERAKKLKLNAQLIRIDVAVILLGEDAAKDDD